MAGQKLFKQLTLLAIEWNNDWRGKNIRYMARIVQEDEKRRFLAKYLFERLRLADCSLQRVEDYSLTVEIPLKKYFWSENVNAFY